MEFLICSIVWVLEERQDILFVLTEAPVFRTTRLDIRQLLHYVRGKP